MKEVAPINNNMDYHRIEEEPQTGVTGSVCCCCSLTVFRIILQIALVILVIVTYDIVKDIRNKDVEHVTRIMTTYNIPSKFYLKDINVYQNQSNRATCWDFSLIGSLEHSYYQNGVKKGYLQADQKVQFSPQAFGIAIVNACMNADNKNICKEHGKGATENSTNGGDIAWLSYLSGLEDKVFPKAVCEYQPSPADWDKCDGLSDHITKNDNPLRYKLKSAQTFYDAQAVKRSLFSTHRSLPLTFGLSNVEWLIPCPSGGLTDRNEEYSDICTRVSDLALEMRPCPPSITRVSSSDVCYVYTERSNSVDGEMWTNAHPQRQGEHSVRVVGWNDELYSSPIRYRSPSASQLDARVNGPAAYSAENAQGMAAGSGGFIVMNTWDQLSHSMAYWAGEISTWDERRICPNPQSFRNWLSCTEIRDVTHGTPGQRRERTRRSNTKSTAQNGEHSQNDDPVPTKNPADMCADKPEYMQTLMSLLSQPYELTCVNYTEGTETKQHYGCNPNMRYFFSTYTLDLNGLVNARFVATNPENTSAWSYFDLYHLTEREIMNTLQPIEEQIKALPNNYDMCGFHFLPYSYLDVTSQYQRWYAMNYDFDWEESSYAAMKGKYPQYDYSLLEQSTDTRKIQIYTSPLPIANETYPDL